MFSFRLLIGLCILFVSAHAKRVGADIVHDFGSNPIQWTATQTTYSWDADGDSIDDFSISVVTGVIDPVSGLYVIDNYSTADGGIEKTFVFSIASLNPALPGSEVSLLGFNFYSEKNTEPGGSGGAGSILAEIIDDQGVTLVSGINVSGSLGSNPARVDIPGSSRSSSFKLAIDSSSPPSNDDAQVILGNIVFNGGTVRAFSIPEPSSLGILLGGFLVWLGRRRRAVQPAFRNLDHVATAAL